MDIPQVKSTILALRLNMKLSQTKFVIISINMQIGKSCTAQQIGFLWSSCILRLFCTILVI